MSQYFDQQRNLKCIDNNGGVKRPSTLSCLDQYTLPNGKYSGAERSSTKSRYAAPTQPKNRLS